MVLASAAPAATKRSPVMTLRQLNSSLVVPRALDEVFGFFADARNLQELTPPWLDFRILTPMPVEMRAGLRIDYRINLKRMPMRWCSEISLWDPPLRFVDRQLRGPYRHWYHLHTFTPVPGGTRIEDTVTYACPGWLLEPLLHRCFVQPDLRAIFTYRQQQMSKLFGAKGPLQPIEFYGLPRDEGRRVQDYGAPSNAQLLNKAK